jgi:oligoendopeptidase F
MPPFFFEETTMIAADTLPRWDTTRLYSGPDDAALEADLAAGPALTGVFRDSYRGKLLDLNADGLYCALLAYEALQERLVKPQLYAHLLLATDSGNNRHKALFQRAAEFGNAMSQELLFFELELMEIPENRFAALAGDGLLAPYLHYLEAVRRFKPHTLNEREESLLTKKSLTGMEAFTHLYDELSASFRYRFELEGEERDMTGEELLALLHHPDAGVRERAFSLFLERHGEHAIVYGAVYNTMALDHRQDMELRGYRAPMDATNLGNELSAVAVEQLMSVSEANYPLARRYFRLKARLLGLERMKNTDLYAPVPGTDRKYSFDEARELVLEAYGSFNPAYREIIAGFFTERRIDAPPLPGKTGGAFCMGMTPSLPPYVLMNFTGSLRDVATLAHELGHGLHFTLAQRQTMVNYHAPLPLAETASVFGEMLLTRRLLEEEADRSVRISLLCATIEDIIATTMRQNLLTRFEQNVHTERKGGLLSTDRICDLWWEENKRLFGDEVEMIAPYRWGWSYISHFVHARFYCYSYTFAELLVLALYRKYREEGDAFLPVYDAILSSGGSRSPIDTARLAGIDLTEPDFWQKGYDFLAVLVTELEGLIAEG